LAEKEEEEGSSSGAELSDKLGKNWSLISNKQRRRRRGNGHLHIEPRTQGRQKRTTYFLPRRENKKVEGEQFFGTLRSKIPTSASERSSKKLFQRTSSTREAPFFAEAQSRRRPLPPTHTHIKKSLRITIFFLLISN
jgi:hypothetical protein